MHELKVLPGGAEQSTPRRRASDRSHLVSVPEPRKVPSDVPRMMVHYWASQLGNAEHCRQAHAEAGGVFVARLIGVLAIVAFLAIVVFRLFA